MGRAIRYAPEVRERAVRMVVEHQGEYDSQWAAIASIASKIGCTAETLRKWVRQTERDTPSNSPVSLVISQSGIGLRPTPGANSSVRTGHTLVLRLTSTGFGRGAVHQSGAAPHILSALNIPGAARSARQGSMSMGLFEAPRDPARSDFPLVGVVSIECVHMWFQDVDDFICRLLGRLGTGLRAKSRTAPGVNAFEVFVPLRTVKSRKLHRISFIRTLSAHKDDSFRIVFHDRLQLESNALHFCRMLPWRYPNLLQTRKRPS